ncbi:MAG: GNAT family N-acetyltransferase [Pseudomonadota bacterium]
MAQINLYPDADFPEDLEWQAVSFIRTEWPFAFGGPKRLGRRVRTEHDPIHETIAHVVVEEEGVLMSYATIIGTRIVHEHEAYQSYGLASVFTYPQFRREGWGKHVVQTATHDVVSRADADICILFCQPPLVPFYRQCGWHWIDGVSTLVGPLEAPKAHGSQRMMQFVSPKGRAGRDTFNTVPLYVGTQAW